MEGFFEQNPWVLIPFIIVVVEGWNALKRAVRERVAALRRRSLRP